MLGTIGSLLGGVGSLFGSFNQSGNAAEAEGIAQANLDRQLALSERLLDAQLGTTIDARGNVVRYNEDTRTWEQVPSDMTGQLIDASDREELARLLEDMSRRRSGLEANYARRSDEGRVADDYLRQINQPSPYDRETLSGLLGDRALSGIRDAYDEVTRNATMQALRSGSSAGGNIMASLGKQRATDTSNALRDAEIASYEAFEGLEGNRMNRLGGMYNQMASRSSNIDDVAFQPTMAGGTMNNTTQAMRGGATGAGQIAAYGPAQASNTLASVVGNRPNTTGQMFAGAGGLLTDIGGLFGGREDDRPQNRQAQGNTTVRY